MLKEIIIGKPYDKNNKMNMLLNRLDEMPYDILHSVPDEKVHEIKDNPMIQKLVSQIDNIMSTNDKVKGKLVDYNLDTRIKSLLERLKKD
jgi:hypothetical protein